MAILTWLVTVTGVSSIAVFVVPIAGALVGGLAGYLFGGDIQAAVILAVTCGVAAAAWYFLGWKAAAASALVGLGFLIDNMGAKRGAAKQVEKEKVDASRRADQREKIVKDVESASAREYRERAAPWLQQRPDDGG